MPAPLGKFTTTRGPAVAPGQPAGPPVVYNLLPEYQERFAADGQQEIKQAALVKWTDLISFRQAVLADVRLNPNAVIGQVRLSPFGCPSNIALQRVPMYRYNPEPHPRANWLYAAEVELAQGLGWAGGDPLTTNAIAFYQQGQATDGTVLPAGMAKTIVTYRPLLYAVGDDASANGSSELTRNVRRQFKPSGQNLAVPTQNVNPFRWVEFSNGDPRQPFSPSTANPFTNNSDPVSEVAAENRITVPMSQVHFTYTWFQVPRIPRQVIDLMGLVNSLIFDPAGTRPFSPLFFGTRQFRPGTVLYLYPEFSDLYYTVSGIPVADITCHFCYQDNWLRGPFISRMPEGQQRLGVGWNFFYRPRTRSFSRLLSSIPWLPTQFPNGDDPFPFISDMGAQNFVGSAFNYADLNQLFMIDSDTTFPGSNAFLG